MIPPLTTNEGQHQAKGVMDEAEITGDRQMIKRKSKLVLVEEALLVEHGDEQRNRGEPSKRARGIHLIIIVTQQKPRRTARLSALPNQL